MLEVLLLVVIGRAQNNRKPLGWTIDLLAGMDDKVGKSAAHGDLEMLGFAPGFLSLVAGSYNKAFVRCSDTRPAVKAETCKHLLWPWLLRHSEHPWPSLCRGSGTARDAEPQGGVGVLHFNAPWWGSGGLGGQCHSLLRCLSGFVHIGGQFLCVC